MGKMVGLAHGRQCPRGARSECEYRLLFGCLLFAHLPGLTRHLAIDRNHPRPHGASLGLSEAEMAERPLLPRESLSIWHSSFIRALNQHYG